MKEYAVATFMDKDRDGRLNTHERKQALNFIKSGQEIPQYTKPDREINNIIYDAMNIADDMKREKLGLNRADYEEHKMTQPKLLSQ